MTFLFVLVVLVGIGLVGFLVYAGGALLSRPKHKPPITRVEYLVLPTIPSIPPPATRMARGTTPQPVRHDSSSQTAIPGVISNRDDATERTVMPDDRFSIRKSSPSIKRS